MAYTQLQPSALPGMRHSFVAKAMMVAFTGIDTEFESLTPVRVIESLTASRTFESLTAIRTIEEV